MTYFERGGRHWYDQTLPSLLEVPRRTGGRDDASPPQ